MPDPKLTPGATVELAKDDLCGPTRQALIEKIPVSLKSQVFKLYGIKRDGPGAHNVDHLIPVSLGGSNTVKNLWPQPLLGEWTYFLKNRLEKSLYKMVCSGNLDLKKAQQEIAMDWVSAYKRYVDQLRQK